jgi:DNA-binding response OmpR family regulator
MRVLLVEDEARIATDIVATLEAAGYIVETARDGEEAWFRGDSEDYDLVILDLGLPKMDGLAVLKRWRTGGRAMPVLVLTARGSWAERVEGIDSGADDYLPKPFRMEELLARARALIRRSTGHPGSIITTGNLTLDTRQMRLTRDGVPIALSPLEYRVIAYLMHHRDHVVPGVRTALTRWSRACRPHRCCLSSACWASGIRPARLRRPRKPGARLPQAWGSGGRPQKSLPAIAPFDAGVSFAVGRTRLIPEPARSKLPRDFKQIENRPELAWPLQTGPSQVREGGWARFVSSDHGQSADASFSAILDRPA